MADLAKKEKVRLRVIRLEIATAVVCAFVFLPAVGYRFVNWDDDAYLIANRYITSRGPKVWARPLTESFEGFYGPVFWWAQKLQFYVFGFNAWGFHLASVALHAANCALILALLKQLGYRPQSAAAGALLWAVHPLRVEAVAWATAQKDLLSAFFCLLAARFYFPLQADAVSEIIQSNTKAAKRVRRPAVACLFFIAALASKPAVAAWPLMLAVLDAAFFPPRTVAGDRPAGGAASPRRFLPAAVMLISALPFISGIYEAHKVLGSVDLPLIGRPLHTIALASYLFAFYMYKTLLPFGLNVFHPPPWPVEPGRRLFIVCATFVILYIAATVLAARRNPRISAALAAFALGLLPSLQIIPAGQVVAERYTYLPAVGLAVLTAEIHALLCRRSESAMKIPLATVAYSIVGIILVILTWARLPVWRDSVSLWNDAMRKSASSWVVRYKYGEALAQADRIREAIPHLEYASLRCGSQRTVFETLVQAYIKTRDVKKALMLIFRWATVLESRGLDPSAIGEDIFRFCRKSGLRIEDLESLIRLYLEAREAVRAGGAIDPKPALDALARQWPELPETLILQFHAALNSCDYAQAGEWLNQWGEAVQDESNYALLKAEMLDRMGRTKEAAALCRAVLAENHSPPLSARLAALLADAGKIEEALSLARQALKQAPDDISVKRSAAWVYHRVGRSAQAAEILATCPGPGATDAFTAFKHAQVFAAAGRISESVSFLQDAIKRASPAAPWLPDARKMLESMK